MATAADAIVARLREAGVTHLFGMPGGGSNLDLLEAASRVDLPFVLTSTETAGALAAIAQAEITGRPGACLTTLGPGAASIANGVACARLERAPLLVFTDSQPPEFAHQRIDQRALCGSIAKWSTTLTADSAEETVARAIDIALEPPAGPVHLDCPGNVLAASHQLAAARGRPTAASVLRDRSGSPPASAGGTGNRQLAPRVIADARKPLLIVGLGARRQCDAEAIRALCERRNLPAMVTYKAKGVVPDDHPCFAGVFTNAAIEQPIIDDSDLLIGVGLDPVELIPRPWRRSQPIVYCGSALVEETHVAFAAQLIAEVPAGLQKIDAALNTSQWDLAAVRRMVDDQRRQICPSSDRLNAQRVVQVAANRLARTARVTIDAGAHMFPATMLWPAAAPNEFLISNGLSTMGFGVPAAIGAALLDRSWPVVALTGDGGLLICAAELLTAVRERLKIIVIVFSDGSLSLIDIKQQQRGFRSSGVALGAIGWPALAASFGMSGYCATNDVELERGIDQALAHAGPTLIEARIDPSPYGETLRAVRGGSTAPHSSHS